MDRRPQEDPYLWRYDLLNIPIVKRLVKLRAFHFIAMWPNLAIFVILIFTGIFSNQVGNKNLSIVVVWILWYSLLLSFMVPFASRLWCMICPMPSFGDWVSRGTLTGKREKTIGLNKKIPKWMDNIWIQNFFFLTISSLIGVIITRPWATAIMLITLFVMAFVLALVFSRRVFCRYMCPVSGFIGLYSNFSTLELRVKEREICQKHAGKECFKGSDKGYGCPWFEFPQHMNRNAFCGLCMECVKTCPEDNIALNLRLGGEDLFVEPWHGLKKRGLDEAFKAFIMTTLAFVYGLVFMGPYGWLREYANIVGVYPDFARANFSLAKFGVMVSIVWISCLVIMPAIFGFFVFFTKTFSGAKDVSYKKMFINYSYALVPLGLAAWIAFTVTILFVNGSYLVSIISDPFGWGWNLFGTRGVPWTPYLSGLVPYIQTVVLLMGLLFSVRATWKISNKTFFEKGHSTRAAIPIIALLLLITVAYLWLWIGGA